MTGPQSASHLLTVQNLNVFYGSIQALNDVSFYIRPGEIVTLIGANGAGKTTILNTLSGLLHPRTGSIYYQGEEISRIAPHNIVRLGISQAPEGRKIFANLSVKENLELGAYLRHDRKLLEQDFERVFLLFPRLKERLRQNSGTLSGGEQQMLAIGRALMSRPKLLLLDEPSLGLAPLLVKAIFQVISEINQQGTTILLVEQNAHMALHVATRGYVLETGRVVLENSCQNLLKDEQVKSAYLGA